GGRSAPLARLAPARAPGTRVARADLAGRALDPLRARFRLLHGARGGLLCARTVAMADASGPSPGRIIPARYQPPLPADRLIVRDAPDAEAIEMDVVFVGGGPAGLAGAIELARLAREDGEAGGELGELQ